MKTPEPAFLECKPGIPNFLSAHQWHSSWFDWPYALDRQPDGMWLALNRNYKPLGQCSRDWVDYERHPSRRSLEGFTLALARRVSIDKVEDPIPTHIYLYNDATSPRRSPECLRSYQAKLEICREIGIGIPDSWVEPQEVEPIGAASFDIWGIPERRRPTLEAIRAAARKRPPTRWRAAPQWKGRFQ